MALINSENIIVNVYSGFGKYPNNLQYNTIKYAKTEGV